MRTTQALLLTLLLDLEFTIKRFLLTMSEKRDSNPRPRPWQGRALPTELFSHLF